MENIIPVAAEMFDPPQWTGLTPFRLKEHRTQALERKKKEYDLLQLRLVLAVAISESGLYSLAQKDGIIVNSQSTETSDCQSRCDLLPLEAVLACTITTLFQKQSQPIYVTVRNL